MQLKIKKKHAGVPTPHYATAGAACFDLYADTVLDYNEKFGYIEYNTGLSFEIPIGYVGLIFPRSSISNTHQTLANCVAVIDSDYRGEVTLRYRNSNMFSENMIGVLTEVMEHQHVNDGGIANPFYHRIANKIEVFIQEAVKYQAGERIGQMMIIAREQVQFVVVDELSATERGTGGYGSTGTAGIPIIEG